MALNSITSAEKTSMPASTAPVSISSSAPAVEYSNNSVKSEPIKITTAEPVDKVTLENRIQNPKPESGTEKKAKEESSKSELTRSISDVLFDYNSKGDLRIKFMDSGNKLIYQTPPVLFARLADLMSQSQSTVNTKV